MTTLKAGTSGFQYKFWRGSFYPERCRERDMLAEYAARLPTVEVNATFYRMLRRSVLEDWAQKVPPDFLFALKASRQITHVRRLKDVSDSVDYLVENVGGLGDKLGALLFQLPPSLRYDLPRLQALLERVPAATRVALEFRHGSWFDQSVYDLLRKHDAALCISDQGEGESATPFISTASFGYLRLRREAYADEQLESLARQVAAQDWSFALAYFKHEQDAPELAKRLMLAAP